MRFKTVLAILRTSSTLPILLAAVMAIPATTMAQTGYPSIEITPATLDFGTMGQEDARTLTVQILNNGGALLVIDRIDTDCGCTVAEPDKKELQPGETTTMRVTFDSKHFMGAQSKVVQVQSNDPATPTVNLDISAFVSVPIMFEPAYKSVNLGQSAQGELSERKIRVLSPDVAVLELKATKLEGKHFTIEIKDDPQGDKAAKQVIFRTVPGAAIGHFREIATFTTNVPTSPTFDMDISGDILSKIVVRPDNLTLRYLARGNKVTRAVVVGIAKNTKTKVIRAEIDVPGFKVDEIRYMEAANEYHVIVSGIPIETSSPEAIKARGRIKGNLTVFLDSPEAPSVQVPITYMLRM